jgi:hypothetical protein
VKVRGHRIEPAEVESVLGMHADVVRSVVMARDDGAGSRVLVAYVIPRTMPGPSVEMLQTHLRRQLPEYMVPSLIMNVEAFPLTPSGKVDRRALPAPQAVAQPARAFAAPRTPTESALSEIWTEVLGRAQVGIDDNFFALGGHSLLATRLLSRLRARMNVQLPLRALFEAPTVAELAVVVDLAAGGRASQVARERDEVLL